MSNYYPKEVLWSTKEKCWIGRCPVMQQPFQCKGDDELQVFKELGKILDRHLLQPVADKYCRENSDEWYNRPLDQDD